MNAHTLRALLRRLQLANHAIKEAQELHTELFKDDLSLDGVMLDMCRSELAMSFEAIKSSARLRQKLDQLEADEINDRASQMSAYIENKIDELEEKTQQPDKPKPKDIN